MEMSWVEGTYILSLAAEWYMRYRVNMELHTMDLYQQITFVSDFPPTWTLFNIKFLFQEPKFILGRLARLGWLEETTHHPIR